MPDTKASTVNVHVRLPKALVAEIDERAKREKRTRSFVCGEFIKAAMAKAAK